MIRKLQHIEVLKDKKCLGTEEFDGDVEILKNNNKLK